MSIFYFCHYAYSYQILGSDKDGRTWELIVELTPQSCFSPSTFHQHLLSFFDKNDHYFPDLMHFSSLLIQRGTQKKPSQIMWKVCFINNILHIFLPLIVFERSSHLNFTTPCEIKRTNGIITNFTVKEKDKAQSCDCGQ